MDPAPVEGKPVSLAFSQCRPCVSPHPPCHRQTSSLQAMVLVDRTSLAHAREGTTAFRSIRLRSGTRPDTRAPARSLKRMDLRILSPDRACATWPLNVPWIISPPDPVRFGRHLVLHALPPG